VDVSVGQIHYATAGPPDAPPVLLLHQTPRSWTEYRAVLPRLGGAGWRAIAMDTLGFGDSVVPDQPGSIEAWAVVAAETLDVLGAAPAHVVGHHTGGVVAVELAAARPEVVRSLVLSSTPYTDERFRLARAGQPPIDEVAPAADGSHLTELWQRRQAFYPPDRPDLLHAFVVDALRVLDHLEYGHRAVAAYRMEDRLATVTQPVTIVRATADPFAAPHAAELRDRLPHAVLVEIEGGMVPLPDQLPSEFTAVVLAHLERVRPSPPS
jgi:pimeloyl-ACP methyl ester carboxylesterase